MRPSMILGTMLLSFRDIEWILDDDSAAVLLFGVTAE
jgi:hypothetical protein